MHLVWAKNQNISMQRILISLLISLCLLSCQKDETIRYNNVTMGNFVDGKFISDQGITYDIVEQTCSGMADTLDRAIISCDVLSKTGDDRYDIRLTGFDEIFTKQPVDSTTVKEADILVENPLSVGEIWYAGGYINMFIYIPIKEGSTRTHLINLVRDDMNSTSENYIFTLKHNAFGEIITAEDTDFILGGTYVSFPIANVIKGDKTQLTLCWTSNEENEDKWSAKTRKNTITLEWERGGYEHKLASANLPAYSHGRIWM